MEIEKEDVDKGNDIASKNNIDSPDTNISNDHLSIPVIKNDNLVAKKVKDEVVKLEDKKETKENNIFVDDVIFPEIPM